MQKITIFFIFIFFIFIALSANSQQDTTFSKIPFINEGSEKITVSILPVNKEKNEANQLQQCLQNFRYLQFVERENIEKIMDELALSMSGAIAPEEIIEIGNLSSVEKFIFLEKHEKNVTAKLVDTKTGRTNKIFTESSPDLLCKPLVYQLQDEITMKMLANIQHQNPDIDIQIKTDQKSYTVGESVKFEFKANVNCFLTILDIQPPNNEIVVLFPNKFYSDNFVEANKVYTIPDKRANFKIYATSPGLETVKAFATMENVDILNFRFLVKGDFNTVKPEKKRELVRSLAVTSVGLPNHKWTTTSIQFEIFEKK